MCACDKGFTCPRCTVHELTEPDDREYQVEARWDAIPAKSGETERS